LEDAAKGISTTSETQPYASAILDREGVMTKSGHISAHDGTKLYYEETGTGAPLVFCHEFAGDYRSWEQQVRYLSHRFKVITYNARGYAPSDVPEAPDAYSMDIAVSDLVSVLDHLGVEKAHVCGFSMGSYTALFFAMHHAERARSATLVGCGYGAERGWDEIHKRNFLEMAEALEDPRRASEASNRYSRGATRIQFMLKDPRGWKEFADQFEALSPKGRAMSLKHLVAVRPSILDFEEQFNAMTVPVLIMTGDEDEQTLMPGVFMKKHIPTAGLCVLPRIGHSLNLEEPAWFNQMLYDFLSDIEMGSWEPRDPRSMQTVNYLSPDEGV